MSEMTVLKGYEKSIQKIKELGFPTFESIVLMKQENEKLKKENAKLKEKKGYSIYFSDGGDSSVGISPINFELICDFWLIENLIEVEQYKEFRKALEKVFTMYGQGFDFKSSDEEEIASENEDEF